MAPNSNRNKQTDHIDDIIKNDEKAKDNRYVDELLTKVMLELSVNDRNDIQEEIHGVKCLAVEETDELIQRSLRELDEEIHHKIPDSQKQAYLKSLDLPALSAPAPPTATEENNRLTYIHQEAFKLRFLRCDMFDVPRAARRMVAYLDMLVELFGEYALQRPISISDFTKDELRHMRKGMIQNLPYRDRSGRRILIAFPNEEVSQIPPSVKAKIAMYILWAAGEKDIATQKMGIVVIVWFDASFAKLSTPWRIKYNFYTVNCNRIASIHCCSPDTFHFRFRRSVMVMRTGIENRSKLIFHLGSSLEVHYKLQGYGIPFEYVPISWTGTIKVQYLKQWMRIRLAIEQSSDKECDNIIECPLLQDVVFRQGTSGVSHPGNVTFRSLIESTVLTEQYKQQQRERGEQQQFSVRTSKQTKAKRPKQLALDIYEENQKNSGRFLIWNNEKGWWNKLSDKELVCAKIEYMIREFQKDSQKRSRIFKKKAATSKRTHPCDQELFKLSQTSTNISQTSTDTKNIVYLHSATSMFTSQDTEATAVPFLAIKRPRISNLAKRSDVDHMDLEQPK